MQGEQHIWSPLPSYAEVVNRFSLYSSTSCSPEIDNAGALNCHCKGCNDWKTFVAGKSLAGTEVQYEVFTSEHVRGLASYLKGRAKEYKLPAMNVLEVGAGSGRLCSHLNTFLSSTSDCHQDCVVRVTATDSGERGLTGYGVQVKDAFEAISGARPHVVIACWMPMGVDWTDHIRATASVLEYILIGEIDNGICGDPWLTWGFSVHSDDSTDRSSELGSPSTAIADIETNNITSKYAQDLLNVNSSGSGGRDLSEGNSSQVASWIPRPNINLNLNMPKANSVNEGLSGNPQFKKASNLRIQSWTQGLSIDNMSSDRLQIIKFGEEVCLHPPNVEIVENKLHDTQEDALSEQIVPYLAAGWVRVELEHLSAVQICRTDELWSTRKHSHTVSFRWPCKEVLSRRASEHL